MEKDDSELGFSLLSMSVDNVEDNELTPEQQIFEVFEEGLDKCKVEDN